jgi:predicted dehydrogenase
VRSEFGLGIAFDPTHRLYDLDNGGGALLDVGIYPATFAHLFVGQPDEVRTVGTLAETGADDTVVMQWLYNGRPGAQLWASVPVAAPNEAAVLGTQGWISFLPDAHRPSGLIVHNQAGEYRVDDPLTGLGHGYGPEIDEVARCLRGGLAESPLIPHADTIAILGILDNSRATLGVIYPSEW